MFIHKYAAKAAPLRTEGLQISNLIYFDKGFGDIAAASSQYAIYVRLACSARLHFYRHMLLIPKKSSIFREPRPPRRILIKALATLPPRLGCDPTSPMLVGTHYPNLYKVCNVNNSPKLMPMMAEYGLGNGFKGKAFIKITSKIF